MDINKLKNPKILIYDVETTSLSVDEAQIKFFGGLDVNTGEYIFLEWDRDVVQRLMKDYDFLIGFNNEEYDNKILVNNGINTKYMRFIDIYKCFKNRKSVLFQHEPASMSLKNLTKILGFENERGNKGVIDYSIFQKNS